jgi:type II secretory pathway pseudopilin PulG
MIDVRRNSKGFTIVELGVIIAVILILSALVFKTYAGIQERSRNTTRQNDLKSLQEKIETFYSNNGYFPSWRLKNMPSLDNSLLVDPLGKCNPSSSACLGGADKGVKNEYEYYATDSDGDTGCNGKVGSKADQTCAEYKLIATYEGSFNGARYDTLENLD